MKYGLVYYKDTENLGDDILSYAGRRFLPHIDYYIDRECMNLFMPYDNERVSVIMNGWYLHTRYNFPPSPYIRPLFIGTHFSRLKTGIDDSFAYINEPVAEYLNDLSFLGEFGAIGCRDKKTHSMLVEKGVNSAYFSGCMTLSIEPFDRVQKNGTVVLCDIPQGQLRDWIVSCVGDRRIIECTHSLAEDEVGLEWEVRERRVEQFLQMYQAADLVVTGRLHCALPSTALGTPVVFLPNNNRDFSERISDYAGLFLCLTPEMIGDELYAEAIRNPDMLLEALPKFWVDWKHNMEKKCSSFISLPDEIEGEADLPDLDVYKKMFVNRTEYMRRYIPLLEGAILYLLDKQ